ncbi:hypothetical protein QAD02_013972 [Eretmocerus hayati]|uniref:Uncharacterized protein n=1 Tax=Eretmocerus hayati TaxID=131215 RepID=A0ACC2P478_9HYME|nr:hypothetical protein QAD02_013972 [Eretmocerus hayati]
MDYEPANNKKPVPAPSDAKIDTNSPVALVSDAFEKLDNLPAPVHDLDARSSLFLRPKRPVSSSRSSSGSKKSQDRKSTQQTARKHKTEYTLEIVKSHLHPALAYLQENYPSPPMSLENLEEFLFKSHGSPNVVEIARSYSDDSSATKDLLSDTRGHVENRSLKGRLTKILKEIDNAILGKTAPDDDSSSMDEDYLDPINSSIND